MRWAHVCDLSYSLVGLAVVAFVWSVQDATAALLTGILMTLCYFAGSVKYRPH